MSCCTIVGTTSVSVPSKIERTPSEGISEWSHMFGWCFASVTIGMAVKVSNTMIEMMIQTVFKSR